MTPSRSVQRRPRPARTRTASAHVEQALVDAAEAVLLRDGPAAVTVRTVAAEAGVAPMGIYNRLGGKDGLIDALLIRGFDGLRAAIAQPDEPDPIDRLRASGMSYRRYALAHPQYYAVMFTDAIAHDHESDEVAEHAAASFGELLAHVQNAITAGALAAADPLEVAQQLWSTVHGAVALELSGLVLSPDPPATYAALLDTLLRGLGNGHRRGRRPSRGPRTTR